MKTNTRNLTRIAAIFAIVCAALLAGCGCGNSQTAEENYKEPLPSGIEIMTGPDTVGFEDVYTIRHIETGKRFVMSRSHRGVAIAPID